MSRFTPDSEFHVPFQAAPWHLARLALLLCVAAAGSAGWAPSAAAQSDIAILSTTVSGSPSDEEQEAVALGFTVDVLTPAEWAAKSAAEFAAYRAIVLGDPNCSSSATTSAAAAIANRAVWGPVITGNVIVFGTDPALHSFSGGDEAISNFIKFAAADPGDTGAYITLSCYRDDDAVKQLLEPFDPGGAFEFQDVDREDAHIVAEHPALVGLTDEILSNWGNSSHVGFTSWPANFEVLAIMLDVLEAQKIFDAADGTSGLPYTLARGAGLVPTGPFFRSRDWGEGVDVHDNFANGTITSLDTDAEKIAFFAAQEDGVALLDTTDPLNIALLGRYDPPTCDGNGTEIPFNADDVYFVEEQSVMHVPAGGCGVHIVDVSDVSTPTFVASYGVGSGSAEYVDVYVGGTGGAACDVNAVAFSYAAMLDRFEVYDVSDPSTPVLCGSLLTGGAMGPGPIVDVEFFEDEEPTEAPLTSLIGDGFGMNVALATGDGARLVNVDDPMLPIVTNTFLNTNEPAAFRISQQVTVDDDVEFGLLAGWASGAMLLIEDDTTGDLVELVHEPTDSAVYASEECNGLFCIAEGQMGLGVLNVEESTGGLDFVRVGDSIDIGPAGSWTWDLCVDECQAYVVYGDLNRQCVGGPVDGTSCGDATECGSTSTCVATGEETFECSGGPADGDSCETDAECGSDTVCREQGGLQIVDLPGCAVVLQEDPPADLDGDGAPDGTDNCSDLFNDQADADLDGYGDACDGDLDNNGMVGVSDFAILAGNLGLVGAAGDMNGDGVVGLPDLPLLVDQLGSPPGPSDLGCAGTVPCP